MTRRIIFYIAQGLNYKNDSDRPKKESDLMKLSTDKEPEKVRKKRIPKLTEQDLRVYQQLQFSKDGIN